MSALPAFRQLDIRDPERAVEYLRDIAEDRIHPLDVSQTRMAEIADVIEALVGVASEYERRARDAAGDHRRNPVA